MFLNSIFYFFGIIIFFFMCNKTAYGLIEGLYCGRQNCYEGKAFFLILHSRISRAFSLNIYVLLKLRYLLATFYETYVVTVNFVSRISSEFLIFIFWIHSACAGRTKSRKGRKRGGR